jgi:TonB family protein
MTRTVARLGLVAGLTLASLGLVKPAGAADLVLKTAYQVLVGFPLGEEAASAGVLLVPGTVIPIEAATPAPGESAEQAIVEETLAFARVVDKLWRTFRLDPLRKVQYGRYVDATVGRGVELPAPAESDVQLTAELIGFSEGVATYRVVFRQGDEVLADSTVNVERGGRAVVGGMDGESAPYIFVVVEPDPPATRPVPFDQQSGITQPVKVKHVNPVYPKSAKEDGVQGLVILQAALDKQGYPQNVRVLHSPDPRLSEAAIDTARQWRWEPARTPDGEPIAVYFTVTFNFRLSP